MTGSTSHPVSRSSTTEAKLVGRLAGVPGQAAAPAARRRRWWSAARWPRTGRPGSGRGAGRSAACWPSAVEHRLPAHGRQHDADQREEHRPGEPEAVDAVPLGQVGALESPILESRNHSITPLSSEAEREHEPALGPRARPARCPASSSIASCDRVVAGGLGGRSGGLRAPVTGTVTGRPPRRGIRWDLHDTGAGFPFRHARRSSLASAEPRGEADRGRPRTRWCCRRRRPGAADRGCCWSTASPVRRRTSPTGSTRWQPPVSTSSRPTNRGHGASGQPADEADVLVGDVRPTTLALVDALGWDRFALLGHSMGGMIAQHVALAVPDRVAAVGADGHHPPHGRGHRPGPGRPGHRRSPAARAWRGLMEP